MLKNELESLHQAELRCREFLNQAEEERLRIENAAQKEAETEYRKLVEEARREGESLLEQARARAALDKQASLDGLSREIEAMRRQSEPRIRMAAQKILERMCNGNDCAHEPIQHSAVKTG